MISNEIAVVRGTSTELNDKKSTDGEVSHFIKWQNTQYFG